MRYFAIFLFLINISIAQDHRVVTDIDVMKDLGSSIYHGENGLRQDKEQAFAFFESAAKQGDAGAQLFIGVMYFKGDGIVQNKLEGIKWIKLASEQGNAKAQNLLGALYNIGDGIRQDKSEAKELFGKACDNGNQDGCNMYKYLNESGIK